MGKQSILNKWWFQTAINALMTAAISAVVYWVFDAVKPTSPQVELQMQKDSMFIELAQELTGKHDTQTVERVKHDVLSYLSKAMVLLRFVLTAVSAESRRSAPLPLCRGPRCREESRALPDSILHPGIC